MNNSRFNDPDVLRRKIHRLNHSEVDGNLFIDVLLTGLGIRTAAELARELGIGPAILSRIRTGRPISDELLLRLHILYQLPISGLKELMLSCKHSSEPASMEEIDALAKAEVFAHVERTVRSATFPQS
jgi:transcriptional regulator with XRE-family HTH domain